MSTDDATPTMKVTTRSAPIKRHNGSARMTGPNDGRFLTTDHGADQFVQHASVEDRSQRADDAGDRRR